MKTLIEILQKRVNSDMLELQAILNKCDIQDVPYYNNQYIALEQINTYLNNSDIFFLLDNMHFISKIDINIAVEFIRQYTQLVINSARENVTGKPNFNRVYEYPDTLRPTLVSYYYTIYLDERTNIVYLGVNSIGVFKEA